MDVGTNIYHTSDFGFKRSLSAGIHLETRMENSNGAAHQLNIHYHIFP